jgi:hypothetical protein
VCVYVTSRAQRKEGEAGEKERESAGISTESCAEDSQRRTQPRGAVEKV